VYGTVVAADGSVRHLDRGAFTVEVTDHWTSPKTGAAYPIRWRITVPSLKIDLECAAAIPDQELVVEGESSPTYWEGAVTYSGSQKGFGYLEMTGYAKPMRL
jgi:predicted secreted hydrolase